jgi:hypothetical protein
MTNLAPPKIMVPSLDQHYYTDKKILLTSGASFTASTQQLECAASWPGYVYDRCRFDRVVDLSYPGVGNEYIADSVVSYVDQLAPSDYPNHLIIVMWSGLGWSADKIADSTTAPCIDRVTYQRKSSNPGLEDYQTDTRLSYQHIMSTDQFLKERKIAYVFTYYANVLFPPCLPRNDLTCNFADYLDNQDIKKLQHLSWIPNNPKDYLYDYAFFNDYVVKDYHPPVECNLKWTDDVLLPSMREQGFIGLL